MEQGSDEWFEVKKDKLSASHATAIGNYGKGLETYCREIVQNLISPAPSYTNSDFDRGNELEPISRSVYEFENDCIVEQVGFVEFNKFVGCSPDGLVGTEGLFETKARNDKLHLGLLLGDPVDSGTIWQMNMQMLVTGRKWCDFASYNPNFKRSLFTQRFYPDPKKFEKLLHGFQVGANLLIQLMENENVKIELNENKD